MIKVLFVCLGNICRSPMAEFVFKDMVAKAGVSDKIFIASAATSNEEVGSPIHYGTQRKLKETGVPFTNRTAVQLKKSDYDKYDYIIGMENKNCRSILRIIREDKLSKVSRLCDFSDSPRDIADPWYTGNFDETYDDITDGCTGLLNHLYKSGKI